MRNILMTIFTGLVITGLIIVIYPDYIRTNSMRNYPVEDKVYSGTMTVEKEYSPYFAPYTLVIDNGLDADVELLVNEKKQHVNKKSHIIISENKKELSINRNDKSYHFPVNGTRQYVFNIDTINDYQVIVRTYSKYALLAKPDSIVKTVENELFFEFEAEHIDFWFEIPRNIEVSYAEALSTRGIPKYILTRIDYKKWE
ncbi:MAG: hypothetical protein LBJ63_03440 [Prevotellaceae bacterium]|nr:hypothetical protein [Prevotellaceae bacterium]